MDIVAARTSLFGIGIYTDSSCKSYCRDIQQVRRVGCAIYVSRPLGAFIKTKSSLAICVDPTAGKSSPMSLIFGSLEIFIFLRPGVGEDIVKCRGSVPAVV